MHALRVGAGAFLRAYADPEGARPQDAFEARRDRYRYLWHYHQNTAFEDLGQWTQYKSRYGLYRHIRSIYNPARKLCDFYAGIVYPGVLATNPDELPPGFLQAIPFAQRTDPRLIEAIGQLWRWSNWQIAKAVMVRWGAALGDVMVQIVDDTERGKVYFEPVWPGNIKDIEIEQSNVKSYTMEYDVDAPDPESGALSRYTYGERVTQDTIETFRNGQPYSYGGVPAIQPNPYGFVPAVWIKHTDLGGDHGEPAYRNMGVWDELNGLASHALDQIHVLLATPPLITGEGVNVLGGSIRKEGSTSDLENPSAGRERLRLLTASSGADLKYVDMSAGETLNHMDRLLGQIEKDHPEIVMFDRLREMTQVTGPAADRLFGDVKILVQAARDVYDQQSVKLFQMGVAIAGWRLARGDWGVPDNQREVFRGFDLASYERGDLDITILPRPLIPVSPEEEMNLEQRRVSLEADRALVSGSAGIVERLRETGSGAP